MWSSQVLLKCNEPSLADAKAVSAEEDKAARLPKRGELGVPELKVATVVDNQW